MSQLFHVATAACKCRHMTAPRVPALRITPSRRKVSNLLPVYLLGGVGEGDGGICFPAHVLPPVPCGFFFLVEIPRFVIDAFALASSRIPTVAGWVR